MPWIASSDPDMPDYCTPANVGDTMRGLGYRVYGRGVPGWRTLWGGPEAVRVDHPAAASPELHTCAELLRAAGWPGAEVTADGWVRVTGTRQHPSLSRPGREAPRRRPRTSADHKDLT